MTQRDRENLSSLIYCGVGCLIGGTLAFANGVLGGIGLLVLIVSAGFGIITLIELARSISHPDAGNRSATPDQDPN